MLRALLVVAFCLAAGCASPSHDAGGPATTPATGAVPTSGAPSAPGALVAARFAGVEAYDKTIWANGTLSPQQAFRPPGAPLGNPTATLAAEVDVTALAAPGIPVVLESDLKADMQHGSVYGFFTAPDGEFRNGAGRVTEPGHHHNEGGVVHAAGGGKVVLDVFYDEAEPAPSVPYVLGIHTHVDPEIARAAFPVGVTVPAGVSSLTIELTGQKRTWAFDLDTPNLMVWAPDDAFIGHFPLKDARTTLTLDKGPGEYVLLLSQGGRAMRILAPGPTPLALRAMPQKFEIGEPHTGSTPQKAEWTRTYAKVPSLAGVIFTTSEVTPDVKVLVASPAGKVVDDSAAGPFVSAQLPTGDGFQSGFEWDSAYGVPGLVAGDYHVSVSAENAQGQQPILARDFAAFWSR